jgi:hypothetical protein
MNNDTTNKKKLELKKTAIANLTLSESQMRMVIGGYTEPSSKCQPLGGSKIIDDGNPCGTQSVIPCIPARDTV